LGRISVKEKKERKPGNQVPPFRRKLPNSKGLVMFLVLKTSIFPEFHKYPYHPFSPYLSLSLLSQWFN
jgi:hypothetical protein